MPVLVLVTMAQSVVAGMGVRAFWRDEWSEEVFGAGGRYLGFLGAVAFATVEAYAVGSGLGAGAPGPAALLLAPPVVLAAVALRSAAKHERKRLAEEEGQSSLPAQPR
ncbi:MAG: hypothetical protein ACOC83_02940 [Gemmatimonadota bacterium]